MRYSPISKSRIVFLIGILLCLVACQSGTTPPATALPTQPVVSNLPATDATATPGTVATTAVTTDTTPATTVATAASTPTVKPTATLAGPPSASANQASGNPSISADGRYVAFESRANNMVEGDTNDICDYNTGNGTLSSCADVFLYDNETGEITLVSKSFNGDPTNGESYLPQITPDGRFIVFTSGASNLTETEVRCIQNNISETCINVYLYEVETGEISLVSKPAGPEYANDGSGSATISDNGRYVAFSSVSSNLVENDAIECDYNGDGKTDYNCEDVFLYDRETGQTVRVSTNTAGVGGNNSSNQPMVSGDGNFVTFITYATNLVTDDTRGIPDIMLWERETGTLTRINKAPDGTEANDYSFYPVISRDGGFVAYQSYATNLVEDDDNHNCDINGDAQYDEVCPDVFVYERATGTTTRVSVQSDGSQLEGASLYPSISPDGRYVLFISDEETTQQESERDYDLFLRDRDTGETLLISARADGEMGDSDTGLAFRSQSPRPNYDITEDAHWVVFASFATNFVEEDNNVICPLANNALSNCVDIFLMNRQTGDITLVSRSLETP